MSFVIVMIGCVVGIVVTPIIFITYLLGLILPYFFTSLYKWNWMYDKKHWYCYLVPGFIIKIKNRNKEKEGELNAKD